MDAVGIVEDEAWELSRMRAVAPSGRLAEVRRLAGDAVTYDDERPLLGSLPHQMLLEHARRKACGAVARFGTPALGTGRRRQWRSQC